MRVLNPNTGEEIVPVVTTNIFVSVTDYGLKEVLKEIVLSFGQHHWEWVAFSSNKSVDLKDIGDRFSSFDNAINRGVNDLYTTLYEFQDFNEVIKEWDSIKYIDNIKTVYKAEKE